MKRSVIDRFISRYNLAREANSVTWESDGKTLSTRFKSDDGNMSGIIVQENVGFDAGEYHIHETSTLASLMNVLGEDITLKVVKRNDSPKSIQLTDGASTITYALADAAAMKPVRKPDESMFGSKSIELDIEKEFSDWFNRARSAMSDTDKFTLIADPTTKTATIILGYSKDTNSNKVTRQLSPRIVNDIFGPFSFSSKFLKEMMSVNKDALCGSIIAFSRGILQIEFVMPDAKIVYYLIRHND